ncbi:MAG TPA: DUF2190 family protein [Candidatus Gastranaerophilales bacterium]|nr:DUF2190 family protein [Candidatus Gastranaerophilales bacterium]
MEKTYKPLLMDSIKAAVDIEKQRFINFNGNYCGDKQKAYGVSDVEMEAGQYAPIALNGILLIKTSGVLAVGDKVTSDAVGKAKKAGDADPLNGYALDAASGADEVIRIAKGI